MDSSTRTTTLPMVRIQRRSGVTLQRQICDAIRAAIHGRDLEPGTRLPPSRQLAADLGLARITVETAFAQLRAEGYLDARTGAGTFVAADVPEELPGPGGPPAPGADLIPSARGLEMQALWGTTVHPVGATRPFALDLPAFDEFPIDLWRRLEARHLSERTLQNLAYSEPGGSFPLRTEIAGHLRSHRGLACDPSQVVITHGSQQALNLAAYLLLDPGEAAWIEDPAGHEARIALGLAGAECVPVPVDDQGLVVARGVALAPAARLAYVCPSHQFPLGVELALERRLALLDWASRANACILEDDLDADLRAAGRPQPSLFSLDRDGRVVYIGTFSHTVFPGLRLGFAVVPASLAPAFTAGISLWDRVSASVSQRTLADFLGEGHYHRHLARMRRACDRRRRLLAARLRRGLGRLVAVRAAGSGLHVVAELAGGVPDQELARAAARDGLVVYPLSAYYQGPDRRSGLVLGIAGCSEAGLIQAADRLVLRVRAFLEGGRPLS